MFYFYTKTQVMLYENPFLTYNFLIYISPICKDEILLPVIYITEFKKKYTIQHNGSWIIRNRRDLCKKVVQVLKSGSTSTKSIGKSKSSKRKLVLFISLYTPTCSLKHFHYHIFDTHSSRNRNRIQNVQFSFESISKRAKTSIEISIISRLKFDSLRQAPLHTDKWENLTRLNSDKPKSKRMVKLRDVEEFELFKFGYVKASAHEFKYFYQIQSSEIFCRFCD